MSSEPSTAVRTIAGRLPAAAERLAASVVAARAEIALVAVITLIAAVIRLWEIGTVPLGLHGDEAWTGLDAQRIGRDGWIGPYAFSALGQPIGPLYFTAFVFTFLPETTTTVRLSMAVWGIATIPISYLAFRAMFDQTIAGFAALMLAIMTWHLHLTRTGLMVTTWPFVEMLALWLLWLALRRSSIWLYVAAGAVAGAGVYTYNAYLLFLPVLGVPIAWAFFAERGAGRMRIVAGAVVVAAVAGIAAWPMFTYVRENTYVYRYHQKVVGLQYSDAWEDGGFTDRVDLLWDRGIEWGKALAIGDRPDLGDGLATAGQPVVDPVMLSLAAAGALMALRNIRRVEYATVLAAFPIMVWGALLTVLDGLFRRTFGMTPFVAVLAALPLAWLWRRMLLRADATGYTMAAGLLAALAIVGALNVRAYFGPVQQSFAITFTYPYQLDEASRYVTTLPPDTSVYLYSDRWGFRYETRKFLAPDYVGVDRSREFRTPKQDGPLDFSVPPGERAVFVFTGGYVDELDSVAAIYPGGVASEGVRGKEVMFRAYYLDSAPELPAMPSSGVSGAPSLAGPPAPHRAAM